MAMTEVDKSSRSMERTFYAKLGPVPSLPSSPAETGQIKPDDEVVRRGAMMAGTRQ
jgi:hypothetical protein